MINILFGSGARMFTNFPLGYTSTKLRNTNKALLTFVFKKDLHLDVEIHEKTQAKCIVCS